MYIADSKIISLELVVFEVEKLKTQCIRCQ